MLVSDGQSQVRPSIRLTRLIALIVWLIDCSFALLAGRWLNSRACRLGWLITLVVWLVSGSSALEARRWFDAGLIAAEDFFLRSLDI